MERILVVDDEEKMRHLLSLILREKGRVVDQAGDGLSALEMMKGTLYDMVISDIKMPRMDGVTLLNEIMKMESPCPVVFITAFATIDSAVEAMRNGASDYITKPFEAEKIKLTVERTLKLSRVMVENRSLKQELREMTLPDTIISTSDGMKRLIDMAFRVAQTDSSVLILGESGTGKELLAKYIHVSSSRKKERFVAVNCAAISASLVESELFGFEKGAFTGADKLKKGKFEYASGGTLFLDEIGDLPFDIQAKLLRALQEKKITRVGGNEEIGVDVRIICATNQNLEKAVKEGRFREDLFFRINVFPMETPPLRERRDDVVPIANYFLNTLKKGKECGFSKGAENVLRAYDWPGNVRELSNVVERAVIIASDPIITEESLFFLKSATISPQTGGNETGFKLPAQGIDLKAFELDMAKQALSMASDNQSAAAKLLGLTRAKFRVILKQIK